MAALTTEVRALGATTRSKRAAIWKHFDLTLALSAVLLSAFGVLMIYSASRDLLLASGLNPQLYMKKQALFVVVGVVAMIIVAAVDYRRFLDLGPLLYGAGLFILLVIYAPHIGHKSRGAQAWIALPGGFQMEPSEFAKILLILALASYMASKKGVITLRTLGVILGAALVPIVLIYKQPDLGTALVLGAVLVAMLMVGGVRGRHMAMLGLLLAVVITGALHFNVLKHYQTQRLTSFLDPTSNTQAATYNLNESKLTISAGGITGKGLFKGTQTNLNYVPEQHTDFIFTAVGEQLGLVGSGAMLLGFGFLLWRIYRAAVLSRDQAGSLICAGVIGMLVFQVFENVGMTMGIMPIAGIPLPFMSYGGSAILASFIGIGLVLNVRMHRFG